MSRFALARILVAVTAVGPVPVACTLRGSQTTAAERGRGGRTSLREVWSDLREARSDLPAAAGSFFLDAPSNSTTRFDAADLIRGISSAVSGRAPSSPATGLLGPDSNEPIASVNIVNFLFANSDFYMNNLAGQGALGRFLSQPVPTQVNTSEEAAPTHGQNVIRSNRDTLYSAMILDLTEDAVVTFPVIPGNRFVSMGTTSQRSDTWPAIYEPGQYKFSQRCECESPCRATEMDGTVCTGVPTRYAFLLIRTQVVPENLTDSRAVRSIQRNFTVQQASVGLWEPKNWNQEQFNALQIQFFLLNQQGLDTSDGETSGAAPVTFGFFSGPQRINQLYGIISSTAGWAGTTPADQTYVGWNSLTGTSTPDAQRWSLTMPRVPVIGNGMWSITVYNAEGYMFALPANYNSAVQGEGGLGEDGSTTVYFGGCDDPLRQQPSAAHCLPIQRGWNILIRYFRPGGSILSGEFVTPFPAPDSQ